MNKSIEIAKNLHLVTQPVGSAAPPKAVEVATNHVVVIDCSGSMSWDLPKIREQLKAKLPKLLKDDDTVSIIWFSSRGEFGVLLEAEPVATLKDLADVQKAIDRWLKPVGLTGFKEPIEEAGKLTARLLKKRPGSVCSLFFMSDGCDNQWNRADILKAVEQAAGGFAAATFVEYGYYADRPLLTSMAEKCGGVLIFSEDFDRYAPSFEKAMQNRPMGSKRIEVAVGGDPINGFAFALADGDLYTFEVQGGKVHVPEGLGAISYLSPSSVGTKNPIDLCTLANQVSVGKTPDSDWIGVAYAAVSLYAVRMKPDVVFPLLKALGDVTFIEKFGGCFGKQKYSEFMEAAKLAAFGADRWTKGYDPTKVPADDAFTVLDLLDVLTGDPDCRLLLDHPAFKYSRISRGRVDASENLSADEQAQVDAITVEMAKTKAAKKLKELQGQLDAILATKKDALKFVAAPAPDGYSITNLTYNEDRPNISVLVRKEGTVDLSSRLPTEHAKAVPTAFPTFIYRNYALVRDGLVNVERLPVKMSQATEKLLREEGVQITDENGVAVIEMKPLPIINRKMVQEASAKELFELEWKLTQLKAEQKVYNHFRKEKFPKTSTGYAAVYGKEAADWLKEQGLTDYGGFSPKMVQAEATDFYLGKELKVSLKGYSSLPKIDDAKKGKNGPSLLMQPHIDTVEKFFAKNAKDLAICERWIEGKQDATVAETRSAIREMAKIKFAIVVGQVWFKEFASLDENTMSLTVDKTKLDGKVEMREVEIKI